jgi:hypothetical protein
VRDHADFLAELSQNRIFGAFAGMAATAGEPPAAGVTELDQDQIAFWR